jgi:hypothetical protein
VELAVIVTVGLVVAIDVACLDSTTKHLIPYFLLKMSATPHDD